MFSKNPISITFIDEYKMSTFVTSMNVIEIEFLLNIAYSIFITMHKVLKGKTKHEKPKD